MLWLVTVNVILRIKTCLDVFVNSKLARNAMAGHRWCIKVIGDVGLLLGCAIYKVKHSLYMFNMSNIGTIFFGVF